MAVGTELLLGQIANTNAAWLGERLAAAGVDSHFHQVVGDNNDRIVLALRTALARSDGVIVCGGLGPTQDDLTREALAEVMNVPLDRDEAILDRVRSFFAERGRTMPESNAKQADVPRGALPILQTSGTAPGLICPLGSKVVYVLPGPPHELAEMFTRAVRPDLQRRLAEAGETATIMSRVLRTWGMSESALAEAVSPRFEALDVEGSVVTIAFQASGIEGIKLRITAKAPTEEGCARLLDAEEKELRALLGPSVFGLDSDSMEMVVARELTAAGLTLGIAESLTAGLAASRLASVPGASDWLKGSMVTYATDAKRDLLGLPEGPVVSEEAAIAMAEGARRVLKADVGLSLTGVAGPEDQDGQPRGTVFVGLAMAGAPGAARRLWLPGDRERVRQFAAISALDLLRRRLQSS